MEIATILSLALASTVAVTPIVHDLYGHELRGNFLVVHSDRNFKYTHTEIAASLGAPYSSNYNYVFELPTLDLDLPIYILQGKSKAERAYTKNVEGERFEVAYEFDIRKALAELNSKEKGILIIAVFSVQGNSKRISYRELEIQTTKHYTLGICHKDFKTDYAYGAPSLGMPNKMCANLTALSKKGIHHYLEHAGDFYVEQN